MTVPSRKLPDVAENVRHVTLLSEEEVVTLMSPEEGIVDHSPTGGNLLALTNKRVIAFLNAEDKKETRVAFLSKVNSVSIFTHGRDFKPLYQGISLIMTGFLVYLLVGTFSTGVPFNTGFSIAAFLGGAIAVLGLLFIVRFITWEQGGELVFRMGVLELSFHYNSNKAAPDAYEVMHRCFQMQAGEDTPSIHSQSDPMEEMEDRVSTAAGERLAEAAIVTTLFPPSEEPAPAMLDDAVAEDPLLDADVQATASEEPASALLDADMETAQIPLLSTEKEAVVEDPLLDATAQATPSVEPASAMSDHDAEPPTSTPQSLDKDAVAEDAILDAATQAAPSEEPIQNSVDLASETPPLDETIQDSETDQPQYPDHPSDHGLDESRRTQPP